MDDELFTIFRINADITMRISNLDIDNTQENHTMTFTFHNDWGTRTLDVPFTPKDGKYQFIESIDFFDQVKHLVVHIILYNIITRYLLRYLSNEITWSC